MSVIAPLPVNVKQTEFTNAAYKRFSNSIGDRIKQTSIERAENTAVLSNNKGPLRNGDRVIVQGKYPGVVKFVGVANDHMIAPEMHVGVHLHDNAYSTHNGTFKGRRFFHCPRGHGAMVKYSDVRPQHPIPQSRPVTGNPMFPSHEAVKRRRRERQRKIEEEEEKLQKEFETRRKAQMEKFSKTVPPPRISPRSTRASVLRIAAEEPDRPQLPIQDEYDIAYRDYQRQRHKKLLAEHFASLVDHEELKRQRMKRMFGGDEKAERLAETLMRLHVGYEEGKIIAMAERDYS